MRRLFILLAILLQAGVLLFICVEREMILMYGKQVRLRTAPVDPNDIFRGDYISLKYEISTIPRSILIGELPSDLEQKINIPVFTILKESPDGVFQAETCCFKKPSDKNITFIRGKIDHSSGRVDKERFLNIKYGIEKFFVQQDKGLDIEKRAGRGNEIHIPLEINVALSKNGTAVAKNFQWSPLGIGLEIVALPTRNNSSIEQTQQSDDEVASVPNQERKSIKVKVILKNCSDKNIAIVNLPDYASFSVEASELSTKTWKFCHIAKVPDIITDQDIKVLKPEEVVEVFFDFADSRWFVDVDWAPKELGVASNNNWGTVLRIRYCPPPPEKCKNLKDANLIWHGQLLSRNFYPNGNID